ncbi:MULTISPECIES: hypothetical protein [Paraburkholderia]|uniref:Uncharacterized protein n=1 Tax=Paraburkholderia madseniana TaxID=2599607 RepID=A0AAP5EN60_9BURK|nr:MULTISPECIES: hypothetical protein [Paraburkholderia]MCX4146752.1 hypothetical protein [Paraburkholderia madseniana]MDN7149698.1 hypothetical protein [Paraburkholderia sp. WS6]MDQ6408578.1 hypothetical protein [Paraburkholderia madseniana]
MQMNELDLCRIADTLSLTWAAALICGEKPSRIAALDDPGVNGWQLPRRANSASNGLEDESPEKFGAVLHALVRAVERGTLKAKKRFFAEYMHFEDGDGPWEAEDMPSGAGLQPSEKLDPSETVVDVEDLRGWLVSRGIKSGFFFPDAVDAPDYLDKSNPRYAPKMAAAIRAWQAVTEPGGKHPKQALTKWLREHAAEFDLTDDEGKPNETGIEEAAKVANWQPTGGAPKTPGE